MNPTTLCLRRVLDADITRVFEAWSRAELIALWFGCESSSRTKVTNDFRVGGAYRVVMSSGAGTVGIAFGEYREIEPPHRLVFTWSSESRVRVAKSVVTIELKALGPRTELTLTHDIPLDTEEGRAHARGWEASMTSLARYLGSES